MKSMAKQERKKTRKKKLVGNLDKASTAYCMEISVEKTKMMANNSSSINKGIQVNEE